ncbi:MAG TPA: type II toxin-antitoxin system RelE/ParE family toxin [Woeseiaceae bacterium]|nr:type II toxin-antitoxin system RelE/ParE family toxin [Woeseiaceae bacterium]
MGNYSVQIKKSALKELEAVSTKADRQRIIRRIRSLSDNPRPVGVQKLSGHERYRLRQGRYRILYTIHDLELTVYVIRIADRKEVYRDL